MRDLRQIGMAAEVNAYYIIWISLPQFSVSARISLL
ncbi:MAG: hypothetical protein JWP08_100 [Bryobacterales bacterium]|nr:hypothetical protein [Bryobacterales bacterium]